MSGRIGVDEWIIEDVDVLVEERRIVSLLNKAIWADEATERCVLVSSVVEVQASRCVGYLSGEAAGGVEDASPKTDKNLHLTSNATS